MKNVVFALLAVSAMAASAHAQRVSTYTFERSLAPGDGQQAAVDKARAEREWALALESREEGQQVVLDKAKAEQAWKVALETRSVANAPYSGEAVNESIQTLADGNRIVQRSVTRVYRDSAGRTRRESLDDNGQVTLVSISDPGSGTAYVYDTRTNKVSQSTMKLRTSAGENDGTLTHSESATTSVVVSSLEKPRTERREVVVRELIGGPGAIAAAGEAKKEDLGQQTIEGVTATGTRTTTVIPAGAIGNEQPIKIVSEEWTSSELQVLVLTKHSDPRTGETTYRLTGITRNEPARSLFEMPEKR